MTSSPVIESAMISATPLSIIVAPIISTFKRPKKSVSFHPLAPNFRHLWTARASDSSIRWTVLKRIRYICTYVFFQDQNRTLIDEDFNGAKYRP